MDNNVQPLKGNMVASPQADQDDAVNEKFEAQHLEVPNEAGPNPAAGRWDAATEKRILRKLDKRIIPCLMIMYFANFVDRQNLAAARLKGVQEDLNLTPLQYSNCISLFFATYVAFQTPTTWLLAYVSKPTWLICGCMALWGLVSLVTGFTHNYAGLLAVRLILGVVEAIFYPGAVFTLSKFYTRKELTARLGWFYGASLLASGFGALFAAGVIDGLEGVNGVRGWRYLFYVEGAATIGLAAIIVVILPDFPSTAKFLTTEERVIAVRRLTEDVGTVDEDSVDEKWYSGLLAAFKEPNLYIMSILMWLQTAAVSFNNYSPTLTRSLGFSPTISLLLTAPPFIWAFLFSIPIAWYSDRIQVRSWPMLFVLGQAMVGCILPLATTSIAARYVGLFLLTGDFAATSLVLSWMASLFPGHPRRRAAATGFIISFANTGLLAGGYYFVSDKFGPDYRGSFAIILAMLGGAAIMVFVLRFYLQHCNRKLDKLEQEMNTQREASDIVDRTAEIEGISAGEAAALRARFRFIL